MRKAVFVIMMCLITCLVGCGVFQDEESVAAQTLEKLVCAIEDRDAEQVKSLFAPFVVESTNKDGRLDDDIAYILQYISDDISDSSYDDSLHTVDYIGREGYKKDVYCTYLLETLSETYKVHIVMRTSAWGVYKGKGILLMEVWSENDIERAIATNDLDDFKFKNSDNFMGIWYPTEDDEGKVVAGTKSGMEFEEP